MCLACLAFVLEFPGYIAALGCLGTQGNMTAAGEGRHWLHGIHGVRGCLLVPGRQAVAILRCWVVGFYT